MKTSCSKPAALAMIVAVLLAGCAQNPDSTLKSAKEHLVKNERAAAVIELRNALQKDPNLAEARFLLGKAQLETDQFAAAQKELRIALELKYPPDDVIPLLAEAMLLSGEFKKVIDEFGKTEAKAPEVPANLPAPLAAAMQQLGVVANKGPDKSNPVVMTTPEARAALQTTLGRAQLALGNVVGAKTAFALAIAAKPDYAPATLGMARMQATAGDLPGALASIDAALANTPAFAEGWLFKGDLLMAQGQRDGALAAFRKAIAIKPDMVAARAASAALLLGDGKPEEAAAQIEAMKKVGPKHPQTFYAQAAYAYSQKDFAAARDSVQQLLRVAPDDLRGRMLAGAVDYQLGSFAAAETEFLAVLRRAPGHRGARGLLVATYLKIGQPAKALETLKPVLGYVENDPAFLGLAGQVYLQNGQPAEAAKYFSKTVALDPRSSGGRLGLAASYLAEGGTETAFRELESAAAQSPGTQADQLLIRSALARREFDKAFAAIEALEKKEPNTPVARDLRGLALLGKGDSAGARKSFGEALALDATFFPAAANLARMDLADKKPEDAKKRFDAVLAKDPKNVAALLAIAELRVRRGGSPDEVAALIDKAIEADRSALLPRLALISYRMRTDDVKKAMAAGQEALTTLPDSPEIVEALARAQLVSGETNQALASFNKLVHLRPDNPGPLLLLAEAQVAAKDKEASSQTLRKALKLKPDLVEAQRGLVILELNAGRVSQAVAIAREVQKQRPKEAIGYLLEGDAWASRKSWDDSIAAYRAGLKEAGTPDLAVKLYGAYIAAGKAAEAERVASNWIKGNPKDASFRIYLAQIAIGKSDFVAAEAQYQALLAAYPNNALLLNDLAWAAGQAKDPKAIQYAERAYKLAPDQPDVLDTLGVLLVETGDKARGVELLRQASKLAPTYPPIRLNLARALIATGQKDAAKKELEELGKLGDKFKSQADIEQLIKGL